MDQNDIKEMMEQLGGMTALSHADLPARIFATWATALKALCEASLPEVGRIGSTVTEETYDRIDRLIVFCIDRMEMVAQTQPRRTEP